MLKNAIKRIVPRPILHRVKRTIWYGFEDLRDTLLRRRDPLVPPKRMIFIGGPDFKKVGDEFFGHFKSLGDLRPDDTVLDIGCGIGRMARPLTGYLSTTGTYEGLDIDAIGISWCRKNISSRFPNFRFTRADVFNQFYHPKGKYQSSEYRFPYADGSFDFVFLTSVFTHMFPKDVDHYLGEIARVLKPGGRCLATYFLRNEESEALIREGKAAFPFAIEMDGFLTVDAYQPEEAICIPEDEIRAMYEKHGLADQVPRYGSWCGRKNPFSFQDILVASKPPKENPSR